MEEERRLFYVALIRAREQLYLLSELGNESIFIREIKDEYLDRDNYMSLEYSDSKLACKSCNFELKVIYKYCPNCDSKVAKNQSPGYSQNLDLGKVADVSKGYRSG